MKLKQFERKRLSLQGVEFKTYVLITQKKRVKLRNIKFFLR